MSSLRIVLILIFAMGVQGARGDDDAPAVAPLFASDDILEIRISAPFAVIMEERSTEEDTPATLEYRDAEGSDVSFEIGVRTRGRYRHQRRICPFAPLRLNFKDTDNTLFATSDKLKLVSHCRSGNQYARALLREYLAYRILNVLTDYSFRVRLLQVEYFDTGENELTHSGHAFLIEHRDQLADRLDLEVVDVESVEIEELDGPYTNVVSVFQYLIANADFSPVRGAKGERCCHNATLFRRDDEPILPIPYDFDMTGLVSAPHSQANPRFGLRNVRERLYRGRCRNNAHLDATVQRFIDNKQRILDTLEQYQQVNAGSVKRATRFVEEFYDTIEVPRDVDRKLREECI